MIYPNIDPVAINIAGLEIHWYGIMYLISFSLVYLLALKLSKGNNIWNKDKVEDLIIYGAMGVILGGRIGYTLFYNFDKFMNDPLFIFDMQSGGMSFHGGLIGVGISTILFCKKYKYRFLEVTDFVVVLVPIGLFFGRIGNFINGELWGSITSSPLGFYIIEEGVYRHATQLYEAFGEGIILFFIVFYVSKKTTNIGTTTSIFLISYSIIRSLIEIIRVPDDHIGYLLYNWVTMGQLLSIPMIIIALLILIKTRLNKGQQ